jgi:hypothetical protein
MDDEVEKPGRRRKPKDPTAKERQRRRRQRKREAEAALAVTVTQPDPPVPPNLPAVVTPGLPMVIDDTVTSAVSPAWKRILSVKWPAWSHGSHGVTSKAVTASRGGSWNAIGRGLVGIMLIGAGVAIVITSMEANDWQGHVLSVDKAAGDIFSRLSVLAELVASVLPTANQFYRDDGDWRAALKGTTVMAVALLVVFFAASGFVLTNLSGAMEVKAKRETPGMHDLKEEIKGLNASIGTPGPDGVIAKGECAKRGDKCRELEGKRDTANRNLETERQSVRGSADPQAEAFHVTPSTLRLARAGAMVLMCLAAGYIISLGWGLVFGRRRAPRTTWSPRFLRCRANIRLPAKP